MLYQVKIWNGLGIITTRYYTDELDAKRYASKWRGFPEIETEILKGEFKAYGD